MCGFEVAPMGFAIVYSSSSQIGKESWSSEIKQVRLRRIENSNGRRGKRVQVGKGSEESMRREERR